MASFLKLYNDIEYKLKQGVLYVQECSERLEAMRLENEGLRLQVAGLEAKVKELEEKQRLMTIIHAPLKREDKADTKKMLNDLVREIDHCVRILNK